MLLEIKNLKVKGNGKEILKGVDLKIKPGESQALLGPNASGKSTLAQVISGNPKYKIGQGKILFKGRDITKFTPEKRAKLGIALSWQSPPSIKGIKLSQLLEKISKNKSPVPFDFLSIWTKSQIAEDKKFLLNREVNTDLSGGEKKISELLQILALKPKIIIFDEIDSGLDLKRIKKVAEIIKKEFIAKNVAIFIITHSGEILKFLEPKMTNVMVDGKIICKEKDFKKVLRTITKYNYEKCKKCKLFTD